LTALYGGFMKNLVEEANRIPENYMEVLRELNPNPKTVTFYYLRFELFLFTTNSFIMKKNKTLILAVMLIAASFALTSCADKETVGQCLTGYTYGFFGGLWHGFIGPFDFIGMLIWDDVTMYAQNNNGVGYALGFLIGSGGWGFLGGKTIFGRKRAN
jgi:hypothetical protein